jgi:hypothetical protein
MVPAGKARQFFEELGTPWTDHSAFPPPQLPDPAKLQDIVRKYQVEIFPLS